MKTRLLFVLAVNLGLALTAFAQGTVNFCNACLSPPPDRLVRDALGNPLVGTNYVAQLYYGSDASNLQAVTSAPSRFRVPTTAQPGTWVGGTRTLNGFSAGQTVWMQVAVWDANAPPGPVARSQLFTYTVPQPGSAPSAYLMQGFRGFQVGTPPGPPSLSIRENGERIDLVFDGTHNVQAAATASGPWLTLGTFTASFTDAESATLRQRFYRVNDSGVFSTNAVAYYRVSVCNGFSLIANQLNRQANTVPAVLGSPPDGTQIFKFDPSSGGYVFLQYVDGAWEGDDLNMTLNPGEGAFIYSPVASTLRFLGDIPLSTLARIPTGYSIQSIPFPRGGPVTGEPFPLPAGEEDCVFQWNCAIRNYVVNCYYFGAWEGDGGGSSPNVLLGEAFFVYNNGPAESWNGIYCICP